MKVICNLLVMRPWITLVGSIAVLFFFSMGIQNIYFRGDYKIFFAPDNPQMKEFEEVQKIFGKTDNITIAIAPTNENVFTRDNLSLIQRITEDSWSIPYAIRVESLTNYQHTEVDGDELNIRDLVSASSVGTISNNDIRQARSIALSEPSLINRIVSRDARAAMLHVTVQMPEKHDLSSEVLEIMSFVRDMLDRYKADYQDVEFYLGGMVTMTHSFVEQSQKDMGSLVPMMFLTLLLMLAFLFRSVFAMLATLVVMIGSVVSTVGIAGWLGMYMSMATSSLPIIVMILAIADCVHVITAVSYNMREGRDKARAIQDALALNIKPLAVTSITTAIGFLTFNFSEVPPIRDLGNMVAIGVVIAFILSVTILPALLAVFPMRGNTSHSTVWLDWVYRLVIRSRKVILPSVVLVVFGLSLLAALNHINDIPTEYFDEEIDFRKASDFMDEHLTGVNSLEFVVHPAVGSSASDPEFLQTIANFTEWLRAQDSIDHVYTLSDIFKRLNRDMNGGGEEMYTLPSDPRLAAQYLLLYEMSLPYGFDINNQISLDKSKLRIVVAMDNIGSKEIISMENAARDWFKENAPDYKMIAASPSIMFAHIGERNMHNLLFGSFIALALISFLLIIALGSFKLGMVSLLPNLAPIAVGFGFWAMYSAKIDLGLSVVASMCLGIVVDDAVHFLSKYKYAKNLGFDTERAIRFTFSTVGRALCITTVVLMSGFIVLAQSNFTSNGNMGLLTAVIIFIALIINLLFLPTFLMAFDQEKVALKEITEGSDSVKEYGV